MKAERLNEYTIVYDGVIHGSILALIKHSVLGILYRGRQDLPVVLVSLNFRLYIVKACCFGLHFLY